MIFLKNFERKRSKLLKVILFFLYASCSKKNKDLKKIKMTLKLNACSKKIVLQLLHYFNTLT